MVSGPSTSSGGAPSTASLSTPLPQNIDDVLSLIHSSSTVVSATPTSSTSTATALTRTSTSTSTATALTRTSTSTDSKSKPHASLLALNSTLERLCAARKGQGEALLLGLAQAASSGGVEALSLLEPERHSLGLLWVLSARAAAATSAEQALILAPHLERFASHADPRQWSLAPHRLVKLAQGIAGLSLLLNDPTWALPFLRTLFERSTGRIAVPQTDASSLRLPASPRTFTPLHHVLVYQCLLSRHYQSAYDWVLSEPIEQLSNPNALQYTYSDLLQHYYYAGLVLAKLARWEEACEAFETAIICPAQAVSAIHVDAYKKLILCQLIKDGSISPLPAYVSSSISRIRRSNPADINSYFQLAQLYARRPKLRLPNVAEDETTSKLFGIEQSCREIFERDANLGLVRLALSLHRRRRIQSLSKMFSKLSLEDAVEFLRLKGTDQSIEEALGELERDLDVMISQGWINASVSQGASSKLVTFLSSASPLASASASASASSSASSSATATVLVPSSLGTTGPKTDGPKRFQSTSDVQLLSELLAKVARSNERVRQREREIARSETFLRKQQNMRDGRMMGGGALAAGMDVDVEEDVFG